MSQDRMSTILGNVPELDEVDDHQPKVYGSLTRCEVDGQLYPCSTVVTAKALALLDVAILEMVDVGWTIFVRVPVQLDPRPMGGIVVGYTDDEDKGRTYSVLTWKHGAPTTRQIAARDVDPHQIGLPNSKSMREAHRQLCAHVGKQTGSVDSTEIRNIATALALASTSA
jgi:hypothetical protein